MEIALFGGSFNPPHIGHVLTCYYILHRDLAKKVFILPVYNHPLGKKILKFEHRENMCRDLFSTTNVSTIQVYDWECENKSGRTLDLLNKVLSDWPSEIKFKWVIGSDCIKEKDKWKGFDKIKQMVEFIPIERFNMGGKEISSTSVRRGITRKEDVSWQVPKSVLNYIYNHNIDKLFTKDGGIK